MKRLICLAGYSTLFATNFIVTNAVPTEANGLYEEFDAAVASAGNIVTLGAGVAGATMTLVNNTPLDTVANSVTFQTAAGTQSNTINAYTLRQTIFNINTGNTITFSTCEEITISGVIAGAGGVVIDPGAGGTINFQGGFPGGAPFNTYTGGTTLTSGTLKIGYYGNAGWGSTGTVTFNGGTLTFSGGLTIENPISLSSNGNINPNLFSNTFSGTISGTGGLVLGSGGVIGTVYITGTNTFTGNSEVYGTQTVYVNNNAAFGGSGGGSVTLNPNSFFLFDDGITFPNDLVLTGMGDITIGHQGTDSTATLTGSISGTGIFRKQNDESGTLGTLIFANSSNNTYTGGTNIVTGELQVGSNNGNPWDLATGTVTVGDATLTFSGSFSMSNSYNIDSTSIIGVASGQTATLSGVISNGSEAGILTKTGAGTLILSGTNTYSGGLTTISAGTVSISATANLGNASNTITLNSGTLQTTATFTLARSILLSGSGSIDTNSGTLTVSSAIQGTNLTKTGSGTLILTGSNSYTGTTTISAGTLQGSAATLPTDIANSGTLIFDQTSNGTFSKTLSGSGTITKQGSGNLTLSGANSNTGTITITAGTLTGDTSSLTASINNGATLVIHQTTNGTYSDSFSGAGTITKSGDGSLTLTGTSTNSGAFTVSGGKLTVNGSMASAPVTVSAGTILQGSGTIGTLDNFGTVAPGNSVDTLTVIGNYTQETNSTLTVEIDPEGRADLLDVSGTATLDQTILVVPYAGVHQAGTQYVFLRAGNITGTFSQVIESNGLDLEVVYTSTTAYLQVDTHGIVLPTGAVLTPNQQALSNYLFCSMSSNLNAELIDIENALLTSPNFAFDLGTVCGSTYTAFPLLELENNSHLGYIASERMGRELDRLIACGFYTETMSSWSVPIVMVNRQIATDEFRFVTDTYGFITGFSAILNHHFFLGGSLAYTNTHIGWQYDLGHGINNAAYIGPYFGYISGPFYIGTLLQAAINLEMVQRNINVAGLNFVAHARRFTYDLLNSIECAYAITGMQNLMLSYLFKPRLNATFLQCYNGGFMEKGAGVMDLVFNKKNRFFFRLFADVTFEESICLNPTLIALPSLALGIMKTVPLGNSNYTVNWNNKTICTPNYQIDGFTGSSFFGTLDLGLKFQYLQRYTTGLRYFLSVGKEYINNEGTLELAFFF